MKCSISLCMWRVEREEGLGFWEFLELWLVSNNLGSRWRSIFSWRRWAGSASELDLAGFLDRQWVDGTAPFLLLVWPPKWLSRSSGDSSSTAGMETLISMIFHTISGEAVRQHSSINFIIIIIIMFIWIALVYFTISQFLSITRPLNWKMWFSWEAGLEYLVPWFSTPFFTMYLNIIWLEFQSLWIGFFNLFNIWLW